MGKLVKFPEGVPYPKVCTTIRFIAVIYGILLIAFVSFVTYEVFK